MSDLCLSEGTLQSYHDGQLAPDELQLVSTHLSSCARCAEVARQVESEMELADGAFAAEMALSVPSERLRSRLDAAIAGLSTQPTVERKTVWSRLQTRLANLGSTFDLSPQRAFGYASIVVFFVLAIVVGGILMQQRGSNMSFDVVAGNQFHPREVSIIASPEANAEQPAELSAAKRGRKRAASIATRNVITRPADDNVVNLAHRQLPGEKNYLQAISLLTEAIETNGETSLKPTLLADYKRNLEVVNEAIKATQRTARTNPDSSDAAEMLFAVYQSKLDLLSAVAEQTQPMIARR